MRLLQIHKCHNYDMARQMITDSFTSKDKLFLMDYDFDNDNKMTYRILEYELYSSDSLDKLLLMVENLEKGNRTRFFNIFLKYHNVITLVEREPNF